MSVRMLLIYYVIFSKLSVEQQRVLLLLFTTLKMLLLVYTCLQMI